MDPLLKLLINDASPDATDLALKLGCDEAEVRQRLKQFEHDQIILGYRAVLNESKLEGERVRAMIEVRITPERGGGFAHFAARVAQHPEVRSCFLVSGGYDLLVEVEGASLRDVAGFVSERLAALPGVLSTATHFVLQAYKEQGVLLAGNADEDRLSVSP